MAKLTGPTNPYLKRLISILKEKSFQLNAPIWLTIAKKLEKPTRKRIKVNLSRIERNTKENDTVIIPGKVLSSGELTKPVRIAAWQFSKTAKEKIEKSKGKYLSIEELIKENPKGSGIKIIT